MDREQTIVVLIDADNTQIGKLESVLREITAYGRIVVKRAYGNWKKDVLKNWEEEIKRLAIKPVQQFDYVTNKNATDMALVIEAVDLLHENRYDTFAIVASDSDYTPIAIRLRESALQVIGVGEKKTPEAFRNACDEFIYLENIESHRIETVTHNPSELHRLLRIASDKYQDDEGYVNVASAGTFIRRTKSDFNIREFGFEKIPDFLYAFPEKYDVKKYRGKGTVNIIAYRCLD